MSSEYRVSRQTDIQIGAHRLQLPAHPKLKGSYLGRTTTYQDSPSPAQFPHRIAEIESQRALTSIQAVPVELHQVKELTPAVNDAIKTPSLQPKEIQPELIEEKKIPPFSLKVMISTAFLALQSLGFAKGSEPVTLTDIIKNAKNSEEKFALIQKQPSLYKSLLDRAEEKLGVNHTNALKATMRFLEFPIFPHLRELSQIDITFNEKNDPSAYKALKKIKEFIDTKPRGDIANIESAVRVIHKKLCSDLEVKGHIKTVIKEFNEGRQLPNYTDEDLRFDKVIENPPLFRAILDHKAVNDNKLKHEFVFVLHLNNILKILNDEDSTPEEIAQCRRELKTIYQDHLQHEEAPAEDDVTMASIVSGKKNSEVGKQVINTQWFANISNEVVPARDAADVLNDENASQKDLARSLSTVLKERKILFRQTERALIRLKF